MFRHLDELMLTTEGFRDILHIGRHKRPYNFSLHFDVPWQSQPLVKRRNSISIAERILPPSGEIATPLDEDQVRAACALFRKRGINAVVIGFMFSFLNDTHECRAKEIVLEEMPDAYVTISSEVAKVMREYERFSTAAMNSYVGPRPPSTSDLEAKLRDAGVSSKLRIMQSNGGGLAMWFSQYAFLIGFPLALVLYTAVMRGFVLLRHPQAEIASGYADEYLATSEGRSWAYTGGSFRRATLDEAGGAADREDL